MSEYKSIIYNRRDDKVAELILNRPEKINAIHDEMRMEMLSALDRAEKDDDVNVLIIKGNGDGFCSGHDLGKVGTYYGFETGKEAGKGEKQRRPSQRIRLKRDRELLTRVYLDRFLFSWVPIVTQVHGICIGGGSVIQLVSDITIAAS